MLTTAASSADPVGAWRFLRKGLICTAPRIHEVRQILGPVFREPRLSLTVPWVSRCRISCSSADPLPNFRFVGRWVEATVFESPQNFRHCHRCAESRRRLTVGVLQTMIDTKLPNASRYV